MTLRLTKIASDCHFLAAGQKSCDFCNGMGASPLVTAVVAAILRCQFCAAVLATQDVASLRAGLWQREWIFHRFLFLTRDLSPHCFGNKCSEIFQENPWQTSEFYTTKSPIFCYRLAHTITFFHLVCVVAHVVVVPK